MDVTDYSNMNLSRLGCCVRGLCQRIIAGSTEHHFGVSGVVVTSKGSSNAFHRVVVIPTTVRIFDDNKVCTMCSTAVSAPAGRGFHLQLVAGACCDDTSASYMNYSIIFHLPAVRQAG